MAYIPLSGTSPQGSPLGSYAPDLAPHGHPGLVTCENVLPIANGYKPIGAFAAISDALTGWSGGGTFIADNGSAIILGGNTSGLYTLSGEIWVSSLVVSAGRWRFSQHGSIVVGTHGDAPVAFDLATSLAGTLGGSPPDAKYSATVGDFTFLAGNPADVRTVTWSGFGNPEAWTAGTAQSGSQTLPDGGDITGLAGGEFGLLFQRGNIYRYDYVGGDTVWQRTRINSEIGCISAGSIAQAGQMAYFLSERGFVRCDGNDVTPIGTERIDRTFLAAYTRDELENMHAAVDPKNTMVMWSMPGSPGVIHIYNWTLDRWATIEINVSAVVSALSSYITFDSFGADTFDAATQLFDDPEFNGGVPLLFVVSSAGVLGTLTGSNLAAVLKTAFNELEAGGRARPYRMNLVSDAVAGVTVAVDARQRLGNSAGVVTRNTMQTSGSIPIRANGRFLSFEVTLAAGTTWSFVQGLEVEAGSGGKR
jgi:hypothetical protein